jgi:EF hand
MMLVSETDRPPSGIEALTFAARAGLVGMKPFAAVLVIISLTAAAAPAMADPPVRGPRPRVALRARFDINRDGRLDRAERAAMRTYIYAKLIRRFDRNRDGRVGPGEVPPRLAERLRRFDRNGDGWIDPGEFIAPAPRGAGR